jgi:hypothetical protein
MLASGEAIRIRRKAHQPFEIIRLKKSVEPSDSAYSACSLTVSDMRIHAGEIECGAIYLQVLEDKIETFKPMSLPVITVDAVVFQLPCWFRAYQMAATN